MRSSVSAAMSAKTKETRKHGARQGLTGGEELAKSVRPTTVSAEKNAQFDNNSEDEDDLVKQL